MAAIDRCNVLGAISIALVFSGCQSGSDPLASETPNSGGAGGEASKPYEAGAAGAGPCSDRFDRGPGCPCPDDTYCLSGYRCVTTTLPCARAPGVCTLMSTGDCACVTYAELASLYCID